MVGKDPMAISSVALTKRTVAGMTEMKGVSLNQCYWLLAITTINILVLKSRGSEVRPKCLNPKEIFLVSAFYKLTI